MSCGSHCQEITFLKNAGFFFSWALRGLHLFPHVQSRWVHAPISCHWCSGRRLPTDFLLAVSWRWIAVCLLGTDRLLRAKPRSRAATFHSHTAADRIVQAKLPVAVCHLLYKRSWGPEGCLSSWGFAQLAGKLVIISADEISLLKNGKQV